MKRALSILTVLAVAAACDPNTKPTTLIRNETEECPKAEDPADSTAITISSIEVAFVITPEELEELQMTPDYMLPAGEYGGNILGAPLTPCPRVTDVEMSEQTYCTCADSGDIEIEPIDCGIYNVRVTNEAGTVCEINEEMGNGPIYLCFSHARWAIGGNIVDACDSQWNPEEES